MLVFQETPIGVGETGCQYKVTDPDGNQFIEKIVIDFNKISSEEINKKFDIKKEILTDPEQENPELTKYIKVTLVVKKPLDFDQIRFYSFNLRATVSCNAIKHFKKSFRILFG